MFYPVLELELSAHSSILVWKTAWTENRGRLKSMGSQKSRTWLSNWAHTHMTEILLLSLLYRWEDQGTEKQSTQLTRAAGVWIYVVWFQGSSCLFTLLWPLTTTERIPNCLIFSTFLLLSLRTETENSEYNNIKETETPTVIKKYNFISKATSAKKE